MTENRDRNEDGTEPEDGVPPPAIDLRTDVPHPARMYGATRCRTS